MFGRETHPHGGAEGAGINNIFEPDTESAEVTEFVRGDLGTRKTSVYSTGSV
jgi:hypothetical protein